MSSLDQSSMSSCDDSMYFTAEPAFRFMLHELATSQIIKVLDYSTSFAAMLGPSIEVGFNLSDWIKRKDLKRFAEFAFEAIEDFIDGVSSQNEEDHFKLEIYPPHLKSAKLRI